MNNQNILYLAINVESAVERRESILQQTHNAGIDVRIINAVTGRDIDKGIITTGYNPQKRLREFPHHLTSNELGCFESHLKCLRLFLDSNSTHCVIFEDDAVIDKDIDQKLSVLIKKVQGWDYVKLWNIGSFRKLGKLTSDQFSMDIIYSKNLSRDTLAILYTRNAATQILSKSAFYCLAFDTHLGDISVTYSLKGIGIHPNLCVPSNHESTIGCIAGNRAKASVSQTLYHKAKRIQNSIRKRRLFPLLKKSISMNFTYNQTTNTTQL